jgi:cardiolipin synthase A/B
LFNLMSYRLEMIQTRIRKPVTHPIVGYTQFNIPRLIRGGREYFETLYQLIREARHSIHFHVYIFDEDDTGRKVADLLKTAASRGIKVYMLVDGYASKDLSQAFIEDLQENGIFFRWFEPILRTSSFYFGRRMHHKVVVVDGILGLVGGINISDKYNDVGDDPAWLDYAILMKGEIALELKKSCVRLYTRSKVKATRLITSDNENTSVTNECHIRVRRNDWVQRKTQISSSYFEMLRNASSHVTIMSSYFIPGYLFRKQMAKASKRGVGISLILAGSSDIKLAKYAERYIYRFLLRNKIRIFEYQPSVLHAKLATYDQKWSTIGSFNVNNISAFASIELNVDILDAQFAESLENRLERIMKEDCKEITEEIYRTKFNLFSRFLQWCSYNIFKFLFYLFTFYFRQRE